MNDVFLVFDLKVLNDCVSLISNGKLLPSFRSSNVTFVLCDGVFNDRVSFV